MKYQYSIAAVAGAMMGFLSNHSFLSGSWTNLLVWGALGFLLGFLLVSKEKMTLSGLIFGAFLTLSFLYTGYQGGVDKLAAFTALAIVLTIIGALGGYIAVRVGFEIRKMFHRKAHVS